MASVDRHDRSAWSADSQGGRGEAAQRAVLITGGATGIGAAAARHFLARDWHVLVCYFAEDERGQAEEIVATAVPGQLAFATRLDVTCDDQCRAAAAMADERFGGLDALVSSAGVTRIVPHRDLDALDLADFDLTARVNTAGPFQIARACAPALRRRRGSIVIVSSYGSIYGGGSSIAYAASKGATNTLTLSLARALAPEIRVNAVCPALVAGGFVQRIDPTGFERRVAAQSAKAPLRKIATPEEVAADIHWLAAGTTLMTGNVVMLDCGMHLNGDA